jgi:hypothetical protein
MCIIDAGRVSAPVVLIFIQHVRGWSDQLPSEILEIEFVVAPDYTTAQNIMIVAEDQNRICACLFARILFNGFWNKNLNNAKLCSYART